MRPEKKKAAATIARCGADPALHAQQGCVFLLTHILKNPDFGCGVGEWVGCWGFLGGGRGVGGCPFGVFKTYNVFA